MGIIECIIKEFFPGKSLPGYQRLLVKWLFAEHKISTMLQEGMEQKGLGWVQFIIEKLNIGYDIHPDDYDHIPEKGPAIIISNHPTVIDGLILLNTVAAVRNDIKIIANHVLPIIFPATKCISIGIKNMSGKIGHRQFAEMNNHLKKGGVLIICPAGKLASISLKGLREHPWHAGFAQLSLRNNAALVPVNINGRNSFQYYFTAFFWRKLSNLMVIREGLRHQGQIIRIKIGEQIKLPVCSNDKENLGRFTEQCQRHLLQLGKNKNGVLPTYQSIAKQENRQDLLSAISRCEILKEFADGKILLIYCHQNEKHSPIINELGRLREICFRESGTGTGGARDNDSYDLNYSHIILWQPCEKEIVGAYRVQPAGEAISQRGLEGLYSYNFFKYHNDFLPQVAESIEIGRGFVQLHYQKTNALDCLWQGIFCFAYRHPEYKYFLGMLTISKNCNSAAQQLIATFYKIYFSTEKPACTPTNEYLIKDTGLSDVFSGDDFDTDWKILRSALEKYGCELPWPYKQAAKWYKPGGSKILSFAEDASFNSVVGLNICEINSLKKMYFKHYITNNIASD
jgi:putative hemolysin